MILYARFDINETVAARPLSIAATVTATSGPKSRMAVKMKTSLVVTTTGWVFPLNDGIRTGKKLPNTVRQAR